ncbi:MAG: hypothetical protein QG637_1480 [Chloroflexota bacterium]|nr:hypothetical protein [Chloroflexota bacterium]
MSQELLVRQFIRDTSGQPVAVILPMEEYALVRPILENRDQELGVKLRELELAAKDPLFLADLRATMAAFEVVDTEWWEHST